MRKGIVIATIIWLIAVIVGCSNNGTTTTAISSVTSTTNSVTTQTSSSTTSTQSSTTVNTQTSVTTSINTSTQATSSIPTITSSTSTVKTVTIHTFIEDYPIDPAKIAGTTTVLDSIVGIDEVTVYVRTTTLYKTEELTDDEYYHLVYPHFYDPDVCACKWF